LNSVPRVNVPDMSGRRGFRRFGGTTVRNLPDGRQVMTLPDGTRIVTRPDGTKKVFGPGQKIPKRTYTP
ncbi:MAG TPA: T-complex 10 C-terminal domain-containing protein, partial [Pyrinomonadaceae bacterium]